jgi:methylenetetrahydrofolate reductase (NADPH)
MKKIIEILKSKKSTRSYEFFPPKDEEGFKKLMRSAAELVKYKPDFFSVTYGAGGSTRGSTLRIAEELQKMFDVPVMHHLTIIGHKRDELIDILDEMKSKNIRNVLALRGDPPKDKKSYNDVFYEMNHTYELIALIRKRYKDYFSIGVAGFCESFDVCPDKDNCDRFLKMKVESGADFVITQLFYEKEAYFNYINKLKTLGIQIPVIAGILPISDHEKIFNFAKSCGAKIPQELKNIFTADLEDKVKYEKANRFMAKMVSDLIREGAAGIHFYTLNRSLQTANILKEIMKDFSEVNAA